MYHDYTKRYADEAMVEVGKCIHNNNYVLNYDKYGKYLTFDNIMKYLGERNKSIGLHNNTRNEIIAENTANKEKLISALKELIPEKKIFKTRKKGRGWMATDIITGEFRSHYNKVWQDIEKFTPQYLKPLVIPSQINILYQGVNLIAKNNDCVEGVYSVQGMLDGITEVIKSHTQKMLQGNEKLLKAKAYITEHGLDDSLCVTADDYFKCANDYAEEEYTRTMDGVTIDVTHSDGDDCEWEVGEHRCNCGNNRYYLEVDGDFISGFYSYGQWC